MNIEPTAAVMPSADHILWSRIGWPYQPADLQRIVEEDRAVFEWGGFYRPMADLPLYRPEMRAWPPSRGHREWLDANAEFRRDVLARLGAHGALRAAEIPDTAAVSWRSTGWSDNRNVQQMLELLAMRGEVAVARRDTRGRVWDLAERVYPPDEVVYTAAEAARLRAERRLAAAGIARARALVASREPVDVKEIGRAAVVDGVAGEWRVDASLLDEVFAAPGRTALLSPFDRLVFDRVRASELFEYDYLLEMYKPKAKRRWGYFALPILHGDSLVGKLDAISDRAHGVFRVNAIHEDAPFSGETADAVRREIAALAAWLGLEPRGAVDA